MTTGKNNFSRAEAMVESVLKGGNLKRILEDEGGDTTGALDKDKAKEIVEMLQDAQNIMDEAYNRLEASGMAMEDETFKTVKESLGKMTEDINTIKDGVASMAGMTEDEINDDAEADMAEDEGGIDTGIDPADLDTPSTHQFTVKGVTDDQAFMNELADLCAKHDGVMTANEEDTIINQVKDPEREGEQEDDKEVSKEIKAHLELEGKLRKVRMTEGIKVAMLGREITPKRKRRVFESGKRKQNRRFGK